MNEKGFLFYFNVSISHIFFRAKIHGWPNTYVFTKTMGEMLMQQSKENLSLVIIRPTIVSGTYKEPFPGWVEDLK